MSEISSLYSRLDSWETVGKDQGDFEENQKLWDNNTTNLEENTFRRAHHLPTSADKFFLPARRGSNQLYPVWQVKETPAEWKQGYKVRMS